MLGFQKCGQLWCTFFRARTLFNRKPMMAFPDLWLVARARENLQEATVLESLQKKQKEEKKAPGKCVIPSNSGGSRIVLSWEGGVGVGGGWGELMNRSINYGKSPDRLDCHFSIFKFGPLSNKGIMFAIMNSKEDLFVNHILLMAKKCIYSSRWNKIKPSLQYYIRWRWLTNSKWWSPNLLINCPLT